MRLAALRALLGRLVDTVDLADLFMSAEWLADFARMRRDDS